MGKLESEGSKPPSLIQVIHIRISTFCSSHDVFLHSQYLQRQIEAVAAKLEARLHSRNIHSLSFPSICHDIPDTILTFFETNSPTFSSAHTRTHVSINLQNTIIIL